MYNVESDTYFIRANGILDYFKKYGCVLVKHLDRNICIVYKPIYKKYYLFSKGYGKVINLFLTDEDRKKLKTFNCKFKPLSFNDFDEAINYYYDEMYGGDKK